MTKAAFDIFLATFALVAQVLEGPRQRAGAVASGDHGADAGGGSLAVFVVYVTATAESLPAGSAG